MGLSVCLSVKSHLTYGASVRPENAVTYSAGNEGQKICGVFSETAPLQRSSTPSVVRPCVQSAIFPCVFLVYAHAYFSTRAWRMRISRHAHDTPPRVQHFSAFHYTLHFTLKKQFVSCCCTINIIQTCTCMYSPFIQSNTNHTNNIIALHLYAWLHVTKTLHT